MPVQFCATLLIGNGGIGCDAVTVARHRAAETVSRLHRGRLPGETIRKLVAEITPIRLIDSCPPDKVKLSRDFPDEPEIALDWDPAYQRLVAPSGVSLSERAEEPPFKYLSQFIKKHEDDIRPKNGDAEAQGNAWFGRLNAAFNILPMRTQLAHDLNRLLNAHQSDAWHQLTLDGVNLVNRPEIHIFIGAGGGTGTGQALQILACLADILREGNRREAVKIKIVVLLPDYTPPASEAEHLDRQCRALGLLRSLHAARSGNGFSLPFPGGQLTISPGQAQTLYDALHFFEPVPDQRLREVFLASLVQTWVDLHWGVFSDSSLRRAVESNASSTSGFAFQQKAGLQTEYTN